MSNSREIMDRQILIACSFASLSETITYAINAIDHFNIASGDLNIDKQLQSFTPPHKKNRRGKYKRSGR
jgi:hypothetical protein